MKPGVLLLQLACVFLLVHNVHCIVKGLAANVSTVCASGCYWKDPNIWSDGVAPVPVDTVDIQVDANFKIIVDTAVSIADFQIGFDNSDKSQTFQIVNGASFTSAGSFLSKSSVTVQVDAGGQLNVSNSGTMRGHFLHSGIAFFGGSTPSLLIDTTNIQNPLKSVFGRIELTNAIVEVRHNLEISTTCTFTGTGVVIGTLNVKGSFEPGTKGVGEVNITQDLQFNEQTRITFDIKSQTEFDHVWVGKTVHLDGTVTVKPAGKFEPLSHSRFIVMNHTESVNGFNGVHGDGFLERIFNDKWDARISQEYTALVYDDASSLLISFFGITLCLLVTLL